MHPIIYKESTKVEHMARKALVIVGIVSLLGLIVSASAISLIVVLSNDDESSPSLSVTTTINVLGDLVKDIGGDKVSVEVLVTSGDPHNYDPTPSDIQLLQSSDLNFYIGFSVEEKFHYEDVANSYAVGELAVGEENHTDEDDHMDEDDHADEENHTDEEGHAHEEDGHVWLDPILWSDVGSMVTDLLIKADQSNSDYYRENFDTVNASLYVLHRDISEKLKDIPEEKRLIITGHMFLTHFAERYNFSHMGAESFSSSEAGIYDFDNLVENVSASGVKVVFQEFNIGTDALEALRDAADDQGIELKIIEFVYPIFDEDAGINNLSDLHNHNADQFMKLKDS